MLVAAVRAEMGVVEVWRRTFTMSKGWPGDLVSVLFDFFGSCIYHGLFEGIS